MELDQKITDYQQTLRMVVPEQCNCIEARCLTRHAAEFAVKNSLGIDLIAVQVYEIIGPDCPGSSIRRIGSCGTKKTVCNNPQVASGSNFCEQHGEDLFEAI